MQGIVLKSDQLFPKANEQKEDTERSQMEKQIAWGWQKTFYSCSIQRICLQMGKTLERMNVELSLWWNTQFINLWLGCVLVEVTRGRHMSRSSSCWGILRQTISSFKKQEYCYCRSTVNWCWRDSMASKRQKILRKTDSEKESLYQDSKNNFENL